MPPDPQVVRWGLDQLVCDGKDTRGSIGSEPTVAAVRFHFSGDAHSKTLGVDDLPRPTTTPRVENLRRPCAY